MVNSAEGDAEKPWPRSLAVRDRRRPGLGLMWVLRQLVRSARGAGSSFDPQWRAFALPLLILFVIGIVATWFPLRGLPCSQSAVRTRRCAR